MTSEAELQVHLEAALNRPKRQTRVWRNNAGTFRRDDRWVRGAPKGSADLLGMVRPEGWLLSIECKGHRTRVRPEQRIWAELVERFGGVHVLVRVDPESTLADNVGAAIEQIDVAIEQRRSR